MDRPNRLRIPLSTLCLLVAVVALGLALVMITARQVAQTNAMTARHNAQLQEITAIHNAQLVEQTERHNAKLLDLTAKNNAQLEAMAGQAQEPRGR